MFKDIASVSSGSGRREPVLQSTACPTWTWQGCSAFAKIGLSSSVVAGEGWEHGQADAMKTMFVKVMTHSSGQGRVIGVCLCGLGSHEDPFDEEAQEKIDAVLNDAGCGTIIWGRDNTVAAFQVGVVVTHLRPLKNMQQVARL